MIASQSYDPLHYGVLSSDDLRTYYIITLGICQDAKRTADGLGCLQNSVERTSILWYNHYINATVLRHVRR